jgi:hypothetical protein
MIERNDIEEQISRILGSKSFADKGQLKRLLEFLFQNMDSQTTLKPSRVIRELWHEGNVTKGSTDVATEMNRLRRAVESYYSAEGQTDPVTISFPNRSKPGTDGEREARWIVASPRQPVQISAVEQHPPVSVPAPQPASLPIRSGSHPRGLAIAGTIGLLAFVTLISIKMLTADRRPQSGRIDNSDLVIMNAEGKELWRKTFPGGLWSEYYQNGLATHLYYQDGLATHLWFGDLDGDGHSEVLFLYHPAADPKSHSTTLICYSDSGKERWRWTPGRVLPELDSFPSIYITMGFGVLQGTPNQPRRIVVMSRHEYYYPTQIAVVDADGKTLSEYWHSGHLFHFNLASLDGREEIIASGISNGYHEATLLVLDPDRVSGASTETARPEVQIHGMGAPHERYRLLFPRSDLNKDLYLYNEGLGAVVSPGRIQIDVKECWLTVANGCTIIYGFDENFKLLSASAEDTFLNAHKQVYSKSKIDHPFSTKEEAEFQKVQCLVGCTAPYVPVEIP